MKLLPLFLLVFTVLAASGQPINDNCTGAIFVETSDTYSAIDGGNILTATPSNSSKESEIDVWYKFVAKSNAVKITTTQSGGHWKSVNQLYSSCEGKLLAEGDQSISDVIKEGLIIGETYYYGYAAISNRPLEPDHFYFSIQNLFPTYPNDLPNGRSFILYNETVLLPVTSYKRGRHGTSYFYYSCKTPYIETHLVDMFFKFIPSQSNVNFSVALKNPQWATILEIVDSTAAGFEGVRCFSTAHNIGDSIRIFSTTGLQIGKAYNLRIEIGGLAPHQNLRLSGLEDSEISIKMSEPITTGLEVKPLSSSISLFPNPNKGTFTIKHPFSEPIDIEVRDLLGSTIYFDKIYNNVQHLNLSISRGSYFLHVHHSTGEYVVRFNNE